MPSRRLTESLETAARLGDGLDAAIVIARDIDPGFYSRRLDRNRVHVIGARSLVDGPEPVTRPEQLSKLTALVHRDMPETFTAWRAAAGFPELFVNRWCVLTPDASVDPVAVDRLISFWGAMGSNVECMDASHHDMVLAITSHIPHLIAYTIVGTASDLEDVTRGEVIKYSAGGFRDFTRIAASDPTMWRDVFLNNRDAVLEMLDRFLTDLAHMREAIRAGDGESLFDLFSRTRAIRRGIIELGQDDARPDFGRADHG